MDNGTVNFGGSVPGEDGDTGGAGVPGENMREGPREAAREAVREAATEAIVEGTKRIRKARVIEGKKEKKEAAVAKSLSGVVQDSRIAGDLLKTVVNRATEKQNFFRRQALEELNREDPLSASQLEFLGVNTTGPSANDATYGKDDDDQLLAA